MLSEPFPLLYEVYFDGSARPNPGQMRAAVFCPQTSYMLNLPLGRGDNNEAEFAAALYALSYAASLIDFARVCVYGDSRTVIDALNGISQLASPVLYEIYKLCLPLMQLDLTLEWIASEMNLAHQIAWQR